jgi:dTDP-4-dehydrorhamnose reductase
MRVLWITGAGGVVGAKLVALAAAMGSYDRICACSHVPLAMPPPVQHPTIMWTSLDIGDPEAVRSAAREAAPAVIVNPAAMTNVDACEREREQASRANAEGPRHLAEVAREQGAHLVHVSTDYVFPGDEAQPGPYREDAPTRPINHYGLTKLQGEENVQRTCVGQSPYTIVRTALVYGTGGRSNFVTWLAGELAAGRRARIVRDQFNTPTLADDLAGLLLWLAERRVTGMYHGAGPDHVGRHEWALAIVEQFGLDARLIDWVTTAELNQPAPRPRWSGLVCERLRADQTERGAPTMRGVGAGLREIDWMGEGMGEGRKR